VSSQPLDSTLFELFAATIQTGLEYVRRADLGKTHIGTHGKWPGIEWRENGLPYITSSGSEGPKDYSEAVRGSVYSMLMALGLSDPAPDFRTEASFLALLRYAETHPRLRSHLMFEESTFGDTRLLGIVGDVLDRYIHINKTIELDREKLLLVYLPIEKYLFDEILPSIAVVPILFLKFDVDRFQVSESAWVERLSDDLHLARGWRGPWGDWHDSAVESGATHALFMSDCYVENPNWVAMGQLRMQPESYPIETVDSFMAALRISTGCATGYAQILNLPVGWASGYTADLTPLYDGPAIRNYPPAFEHRAWSDEVPTVSSSDVQAIKTSFEDLCKALGTKHGQRIRLAMHRLNLSALRTTEEDGVIDAMIAMEALLSDGTQEMTHKVAMRLAGLYKLVDSSRCERVFREMKHVYNYRSKIVHGSTDVDKYRELKRDGETVATVDAAVYHLRIAISVLTKNPDLLDPGRIDSFLLTGSL
jgi:hypothetical protein